MSFITSNAAKIFGAISGGVKGAGELVNARQEIEVGDFNARILEQRAEAQRNSQELLEIQKKKVIRSKIGTQIALRGKSGIRFTGSVLDVLTDSFTNANLDLAVDRFNSKIKARGFETEADLQKFQAQQRARTTRTRASRTFLSTAASLLESRQRKPTSKKLGDSPFGTAITRTGPISLLPRR